MAIKNILLGGEQNFRPYRYLTYTNLNDTFNALYYLIIGGVLSGLEITTEAGDSISTEAGIILET